MHFKPTSKGWRVYVPPIGVEAASLRSLETLPLDNRKSCIIYFARAPISSADETL
jgi:hypothetical protein